MSLGNCSEIPDFENVYDWIAGLAGTDPMDSLSWGEGFGGYFSSNTSTYDSTSSGSAFPGPPVSYNQFVIADGGALNFFRAQAGFQPSTTYYIVECYMAASSVAHCHRACTGSVTGDVDYTPVELGVAYLEGYSGCAIPHESEPGVSLPISVRQIFTPSNIYSDPAGVGGGAIVVTSASSLLDAVNQLAQNGSMGGGVAPTVFDTGWNYGPCNPPDEDPFDSGLP